MPSPKDNPDILEEWKNFEADLLSEGFARYISHLIIGAQYDVNLKTVYRWLTPGYKAKERAYNKKYIKEKLTKEMSRRYWKKYRAKPGIRKKINAYQKKYLNLYRNLATYVMNLYVGKKAPISVEEISQTILNDFDIDMKHKTILAAINKYNESQKKPKIKEKNGSLLIDSNDEF